VQEEEEGKWEATNDHGGKGQSNGNGQKDNAHGEFDGPGDHVVCVSVSSADHGRRRADDAQE